MPLAGSAVWGAAMRLDLIATMVWPGEVIFMPVLLTNYRCSRDALIKSLRFISTQFFESADKLISKRHFADFVLFDFCNKAVLFK